MGTPSPTPAYDDQARQIFVRTEDTSYLIVVEARPRPGTLVGTKVLPNMTTDRPDLQIESSQPLFDGDPAVDCRSGLPSSQWRGIPGIDPPDFGAGQSITDTLTDFACRFSVQPLGSPCTLNAFGSSSLLSNDPSDPTVRQFCHTVSPIDKFPRGDTVLTVQVRDSTQSIGPTAQIVVRIVTPTPGF